MKSPPELWAELSELESLARHLGEFGEIRITKVDPESRVEWEADRASGTVRLEPSGWGTRVVLTVDTPEPAPVVALPDREPPAEPQPAAVAEPAPEPEPVPALKDATAERAREAAVPEAAMPAATPVRRGWFARFFRRPPVPEPSPARAEAVQAVEPVAATEVEPPAPEPALEEASPEGAFGTIEWETPAEPVEEEPVPAPLEADEAHAVLTGVLDTLGAAHHRPFSRP